MTALTVLRIVEDRLRADGYDGLTHIDGDCACLVADLAPCGEIGGNCEAGYRTPCLCGEHAFHVGPAQPWKVRTNEQKEFGEYKVEYAEDEALIDRLQSLNHALAATTPPAPAAGADERIEYACAACDHLEDAHAPGYGCQGKHAVAPGVYEWCQCTDYVAAPAAGSERSE